MKPAVLFLIGILPCAIAGAADPAFERMTSADYAVLMRDSTHAYNRKDYAKAFPLMQRLACGGDKSSQFTLGGMYILGQGVGKDELEGYAWIKLAAEFSFTDYTSLAGKLTQALGDEQRAKGDARAEELHRQYGLVATGMSCHGEPRHGGYVIDSVICSPPTDGGQVRVRRCGGKP